MKGFTLGCFILFSLMALGSYEEGIPGYVPPEESNNMRRVFEAKAEREKIERAWQREKEENSRNNPSQASGKNVLATENKAAKH